MYFIKSGSVKIDKDACDQQSKTQGWNHQMWPLRLQRDSDDYSFIKLVA